MSSNDPIILGSRRAALAVCAFMLAACGQKGALYLAPVSYTHLTLPTKA